MSSIYKGIGKVTPVVPVEKSKATDTPPKQQPYVAKEKKKKDPNAIVDLTAEGQIYSTGGGAGQSYRKYKAKPAGVAEEQAPMFTPEDSVANLNDPRSDGWRVYKSKPAGLNEENVAVVKNALVDRVRKYKMNLVSKYGVRPVMAAIQDTAIKHSNTPEKSLSDISIWVKEIENMLDRGKYSDLKETSIGEACWKTHKQVGMKKKGGKIVPNCVPKESIEEVSDFKKKEIEWELRHEKNNYLVAIDGKGWKVFADKAHAEAVARKLRNKGKNATVHPTGAPVSESINENDQHLDEDLRKWFKEKWVRFGPDGKIRGACARGDDSEGKPKCLPQSKAHSLGKKGRASAAARKRREDPNPERRGKAKNVATKKKTNESNDPGYTKALADLQYLVSFIKSNPKMMGKEIKQMGPINPAQNIIKKALKGCDYIEQLLKAQNNVAVSSAMSNLKKELMNWFNDGNKPLSDLLQGTIGKIKFPTNEEKCPHCGGELVSEELMNEKKDACYHKVKARYKVWPSAYASGALVKCRKKGASNWGKSKQKESAVIKGMAEALKDPESDRTIKNIIGQNPKGSAAEKIVLNRFISTRMADDLQGEDWIEQCAVWLETNKQKLQKEFPELDLSNVNALAEKMYEDFLAASGQLEEDYKKDFDDEIERMIKNIWDVEKEKISSKEPRYLVYSQNTGLELETDSLDDAVFSAKIISKRNLDSPSLVYDRKTKFPVVSYWGSEDMWYQTNPKSPGLHEANPKQQISIYNPVGKTYRQQPMPTLQKDPVDKAKQLSKNIPADLSDPDEEIRQQQLTKKLNDLINSELIDREQKVLKAYYFDEKTLEQIAQEFDVSSRRIAQIIAKAERKLRHPLRAKELKPFLVNEVETDTKRIITFSKENPPSGELLLRTLIQNLNKPDNKLTPEKMIDAWNKLYGLNYTLKTLAAFARNNDFIRTQFQQALAKSVRL
jgi:RNA polymerase sigma factor (sigma-70 family)